MWDEQVLRQLYEDARSKARSMSGNQLKDRLAELQDQLVKVEREYVASLQESVARGEMSAESARKEWADFKRQQRHQIESLFGDPE
jgi:hypothetical protein